MNQITERFPQLAKTTVINLARAIFMGAGPSLLGATLCRPRPLNK